MGLESRPGLLRGLVILHWFSTSAYKTQKHGSFAAQSPVSPLRAGGASSTGSSAAGYSASAAARDFTAEGWRTGPAADLARPNIEPPTNGYQTLRNPVRQRPQAGAGPAAKRNAFTRSSSSFEPYWNG